MVLSFTEVLVGDCDTKDNTAPIGEAQLYWNDPQLLFVSAIPAKPSKRVYEDHERDNEDDFDAYFIIRMPSKELEVAVSAKQQNPGWQPPKYRLEREVIYRTKTSRCII